MSDPTEDTPPHLLGSVPPRPIEGSTVHFHDGNKCRAAIVVALVQEDAMDPNYRVDAVVFMPRREVRAGDKFTSANSLPGSIRWANQMKYAPVEEATKLTWHYPTAGCVPKVALGD